MAENGNSRFDADQQKRDAKALSELKGANIRGVFGSGAGRIAIICVGLGLVTMLVIGVYNLFRPAHVVSRSAPTQAVLDPTGRAGDPMAANADEAANRVAQNAAEASAAAAAGRPYMAAPVLVASAPDAQAQGANAMAPASQPAANASPAQSVDAQTGAPVTGQGGGYPQQALRTAVSYRAAAAIAASQVDPQIQYVAKGLDPTQRNPVARYSVGYYPATETTNAGDSARGATQQVALGANAAAPLGASTAAPSQTKHVVAGLQAGTAFYCKFFFGMNSDLSRKDAVANCYTGAANGATFIGKAEPSTEGVADPGFTVTFDHLAIPGHPLVDVNAVALDAHTMEENVADDVNSHSVVKFSELAIAGLLKGIGQVAGQIQANQTTQTVGNVSTTTFATLKPDVWQIVGGAAGGVGNGIGDYIQKKSDALKTTIKVFPGKDIGVVLLRDVTE
ncbi:TrbI/VirB10 family protein [Burkholderia vietnamiensis]|uniref:TrbI/VirB10 family protein n=1 Tax=Burkholderia vietnamiensis TaxID=60552 RepID=UPI001592B942|nr:TrbI/VirB10 family protein [Burkholderia vietnamiensis]MCA8228173.1 hypothetical protein [Burkholderia vietnamiensis]